MASEETQMKLQLMVDLSGEEAIPTLLSLLSDFKDETTAVNTVFKDLTKQFPHFAAKAKELGLDSLNSQLSSLIPITEKWNQSLRSLGQTATYIRDLMGNMTLGPQKSITVDVFKEMGKSIMTNNQIQQKFWKDYMKNVEGATLQTKEFVHTLNLLQKIKGTFSKLTTAFKSFRMEFLGIMFLGMAMQRLFNGIMKAATSTFTSIMESSDIAGTAIQQLSVQWEYLKFVIGSVLNNALAPFMPMIVNLVNQFTEWAQKNSGLVATILILGSAIGGILFVVGQLGIGLNSIVTLFGGPVGIALGELMTGIVSLAGAAGLGTVLTVLGLIAVAIGVLYGMWTSNLGGIQEFVKNTFGVIWDTISGVFGEVMTIIKSFFGFFKAIFEGNWEEAIGYLLDIVDSMYNIIRKIFLALVTIIYNAFAWVFNTVNDLFFNVVVDGLLYGIGLIASAFDSIAGFFGLSTDLSGVTDKLKGFAESAQEASSISYLERDTVQKIDMTLEVAASGDLTDDQVSTIADAVGGKFYDAIKGR